MTRRPRMSAGVHVLVLIALANLASCTKKTTATDDASSLALTDAAPASARSKNQALLTATQWNQVTRWTPDYQRMRFLADREVNSSECVAGEPLCGKASFDVWCPEAKAASAKPAGDEFSRRRQQDETLRLRQSCIDRIRADAGTPSKLAVVEIGLEPHPYEFETNRYLLSAKGVSTLYEAEMLETGVAALTLPGLGVTACSTRGASGAEYGLLTLRGIEARTLGPLERLRRPGLPVTPSARLNFVVALEVPQAAAEAMKPRLDEDLKLFTEAPTSKKTRPADLLRLEVAFAPTNEAKADAMCKSTSRGVALTQQPEGFVGEAIGYRVLDKHGVLVDWTPCGNATP